MILSIASLSSKLSQDLHLVRLLLPIVQRKNRPITSCIFHAHSWTANAHRDPIPRITCCPNYRGLPRDIDIRALSHTRWIHSSTPLALAAAGGNKKKQSTKKNNNKQSKRKASPYKNIPNPLDQKQANKTPPQQQQQEVPPAYLVKTASDYAYIAKCIIMDERTGELHLDPKTLFTEVVFNTNNANSNNNKQGNRQPKQKKRTNNNNNNIIIIPQSFRQSHFHYFPPSTFPNYEPPTDGTPEVAFLGRSNTGKSSLINALSNRILRSGGGGGGVSISSASGGGELARTSKRPGRTQTINYFGLIPNSAMISVSSSTSTHPSFKGGGGGEGANKKKHPNSSQSKLFLVDLPGFGYASAPDEDVDAWQERTQQFLISRASSIIPDGEGGGGGGVGDNRELKSWGDNGGGKNTPPLKRLYLLLDSRLPEPTLLDLSVMGWCDDYAIPYTIVLTKVDGSSRAHCVKLTNQLCMRYHSLYLGTSHDDYEGDGEVYMDPVVYWTSSKDGLGMEELLMSVENNMFSYDDDDDDDDEDEFDLLEDEHENNPEFSQ